MRPRLQQEEANTEPGCRSVGPEQKMQTRKELLDKRREQPCSAVCVFSDSSVSLARQIFLECLLRRCLSFTLVLSFVEKLSFFIRCMNLLLFCLFECCPAMTKTTATILSALVEKSQFAKKREKNEFLKK